MSRNEVKVLGAHTTDSGSERILDTCSSNPLSSAHTTDSGSETILDTCSLHLSVGLNRIRTRPVRIKDDLSSSNHAITKDSGVFEPLHTQPELHANSDASSEWGQAAQGNGLFFQDPPSKEEGHTAIHRQNGSGYAWSQFVGSQSHSRQGCHKKAKKISFHHALGLQNESCNGSGAKGLPIERQVVQDTELSNVQAMRSLKAAPARHKCSKNIKSFSHELGSRKSHSLVLPRNHSDNNLEDILEALQVNFNTAKEEADMELALFAGDLVELLDTYTDPLVGWREKVEDILILARRCVVMPVCDFEKQCECIVQGLDDQRHELPPGFLKQLYTHILFILTRCTRLLQFHRETKMQEDGLYEKLQQCLRDIPSFERVWVEKKEKPPRVTYEVLQPVVDNSLKQQPCSFVRGNYEIDGGQPPTCGSRKDVPDLDCLAISDENSGPGHELLLLKDTETRSIEDEPLQLICRICEDEVSILHLEAHSTFCALADACKGSGLSINEQLINLADCLEKLSDSDDKPDFVKLLKLNLYDNSNTSSPRWSDLYGRDSDFKSNPVRTSSSVGSLTPQSSLTTPRTCHFDLLWKEHGTTMESETVQQIHELVDIARCVANKNTVEKEALDYLAACMDDLQKVLHDCESEAHAVYTFGRRIEEVLREKEMLVSELLTHQKSDMEGNSFLEEDSLITEDSCYDLKSTPSFPLYKDRTTINDFEILKPISRGAFGKVFLARKRTTGDLFAIKALRKVDMIRKNAVENILAERDILITVCNPFVVRFFYSFTCRENLYLVMEYLNGGDLFSLLKNMGCLDEHVACVYIAELVLALEYLHSLGIVHRDLKPDNILIAHDGHIKLTDFGLSKAGLINSTDEFSTSANSRVLTATDFDQTLTDQTRAKAKERLAAGTPDYLAPEILLGREHGFSADWWSVGVILYECLTGIPPFSGNQPQVVFENILNRKIPWPGPEEMSDEARDIIDRLLIQNPSKRLGSLGTDEVKSHPFFRVINWDTLAMQKGKVAFVPNPVSLDDTSYFTSRPMDDGLYSSLNEHWCLRECSCGSSISTSSGKGRLDEEEDVCADLADSYNPCMKASFNNFSFKNLTQLASMNYDLFSHSTRDHTKCCQ